MSSPTPERIHRKKLARLRKRRAQAAWKRAGRRGSDGSRFAEDVEPIFGCFTTAPRK